MESITGSDEKKTAEGRTCFQRFRDALSPLPRGVTPPPWSVLGLVFISMFSSAFTLTFLFPFLPEMIVTFGYSEEEKGTYVGLVASSVFAGRALGSFFWGWLSDVRGRRFVLLITIFFNGFFSFLFGFVGSLKYAMLLRFLTGLANGTIGVGKSVLYDVSNNNNQAFSMSILSIAWGSGLIMGPLLGGYLALPAAKYPDVFSTKGFFADFPFVLPSLCCLIVCGLVFITIFFKFQEPEPVLNIDIEIENTTKMNGDAGNTDAVQSSLKLHVSQPLLEKPEPRFNPSVTSDIKKVHMSLENLHCESEQLYYFGVMHSKNGNANGILRDKIVSKSMSNLEPGPKEWLKDDVDLLPVTHEHISSQGHNESTGKAEDIDGYSTAHAYLLNENHRSSLPILNKTERIAANQGLENSQVEDRVVNDYGGCLKKSDDTVLTVIENCKETDGGSVKKRSKLSSCWHSIRHSSLVHLLSLKDVRASVALYTVMSFAVIGYEDIFTVFASTHVDYDGLGLSTDEIGIALGAVCIPLMILQMKLYPFVVSKFGIKKTYIFTTFIVFIPIQVMPMAHLVANQKIWLWVFMVALMIPMRIALNFSFTGSSLLINNSVTVDMAGKANGIGMTATAIARTLAPTVGGALFSWSVKMNQTFGPPFDINISFFLFGFVFFISGVQAVFMPDNLDHQKK